MTGLYDYTGNMSAIGNGEILLCVFGNHGIPPTRLYVPAAIYGYLYGLSDACSEEGFYVKTYRYDRFLILREITVPSKDRGIPAKIVTQARMASREPAIFGESRYLEVPEKKLEPMDGDEYGRYLRFRRVNKHAGFYNGTRVGESMAA